MTFSLLPVHPGQPTDADQVPSRVARCHQVEHVPDDFVWMGDGLLPNEGEIGRALDVLAAVPLAGAVGWSVRGNPWSCHPRRLRTAVVPPSEDWDITIMRGVREVDSLSGRILVRCSHLTSLPADDRLATGSPAPVARALRSAGFRLLFLGCPHELAAHAEPY